MSLSVAASSLTPPSESRALAQRTVEHSIDVRQSSKRIVAQSCRAQTTARLLLYADVVTGGLPLPALAPDLEELAQPIRSAKRRHLCRSATGAVYRVHELLVPACGLRFLCFSRPGECRWLAPVPPEWQHASVRSLRRLFELAHIGAPNPLARSLGSQSGALDERDRPTL